MGKRKKGGIFEAVGLAGVAVAISSLMSLFLNVPFAGLIALVVVYFAFAKPRRISALYLVAGYLIIEIVLSISIFGALFTLAGVV